MVSTKSIDEPKVAILAGPTASGKTRLAFEYAEKHPSIEIINADSILVYREMNIGSAKPSLDELQKVPHHLINIQNPDENFTAGDFFRSAQEALNDIKKRGKRALIVGGTGFYLKALMYGLWDGGSAAPDFREQLEKYENRELFEKLQAVDPESAHRITQGDRYRLIRALEVIENTGKTPTQMETERSKTPDARFRLLFVDRPKEDLIEFIQKRTEKMLESSFVDEVIQLRKKYPKSRALNSVGYAQVCDYLDHIPPQGRKVTKGIDGLRDEINLATRQLVKRQRTWFKGQARYRDFLLETDKELLTQTIYEIYHE